MPYFLKILAAPEKEMAGLKLPLAEGANTLGRVSPPCEIKLDGQKVSKRHCTFFLAGEKISVEDLSSSNGVYLNGKKITSAEVKAGDRFVIGEFTLELVVR